VNRMLSAALVAATMAGVSVYATGAQAGISCNLTDTHNNTLSYTFAVGGHGYTNEISVKRNGVVLSNGGPMWRRAYDSARKLMVLDQAGWAIVYEAKPSETDVSQAILFHGANRTPAATGTCYADHSMDAPAAPQPPVYAAPAPSSPSLPPPVEYHPSTTTVASSDVPFNMVNGGIMVKVNFPGYWATMQVDTGAGMSSIAKGLADKLIAEGHATEKGEQRFIMANGSVDVEKVIVIDSVAVGSHTVNHVEMSVVPDNGANMLLGLPVLNSIGKFTIDSAASQLIFG
jgi:gag-polyprotein putative aspartyl protease